MTRIGLVLAVLVLLAGGCGDDSGDEASVDTTTTAPPIEPGDPCSPEEGLPDCIDPEGDGTYVYLIDGGDCVSVRPDPSTCADLDGDGIAGYPDSQ